MELYGQGCAEDQYFMFHTHDIYDVNVPLETNDLFSAGTWGIDQYFDGSIYPKTGEFLCQEDYFGKFSEVYGMSGDQFSDSYSQYLPWKIADSSSLNEDSPQFPLMEDGFSWRSFEEEDDFEALMSGLAALEAEGACDCKMEPAVEEALEGVSVLSSGPVPGPCLRRKGRPRKPGGQPSKNLMAERRRRKRLNDRLSMLRSIVPKISKMDRTSILGDTIDYMRELLHKIDDMQHQLNWGPNQLNIMDILKTMKPNEMLVRNAPKFNVERRNVDMKIEVCCAMKPEMLLSTVKRLDSLGLEIDQCVISCFSDFAMQATCSDHRQGSEQMEISPEHVKQALFKTAGYGGRCL